MDGVWSGSPAAETKLVVEAFTSMTNALSGSGWTRIGALMKASFKVVKASVADGVQDSDLDLRLRRLVSGLAMEL